MGWFSPEAKKFDIKCFHCYSLGSKFFKKRITNYKKITIDQVAISLKVISPGE